MPLDLANVEHSPQKAEGNLFSELYFDYLLFSTYTPALLYTEPSCRYQAISAPIVAAELKSQKSIIIFFRAAFYGFHVS